MKPLLCAFAALLLFGCSQDGDVTVENYSGPYLEVSFDGSTYLLHDGEAVTKRIDIGRKFIFGPDDLPMTVSGEGECKWPFSEVVLIEDRRNTIVTIHGDAGYFDICNLSGYTVELYLSPCSAESWGDPLELIVDGDCSTWMVEEGCWDILTVSIEGQFEDYNVPISPCDVAIYDLPPAAMTKVKGSSGVKQLPARPGADADADTKTLRKKKTATKRAQ